MRNLRTDPDAYDQLSIVFNGRVVLLGPDDRASRTEPTMTSGIMPSNFRYEDDPAAEFDIGL